MNIDDPGTPQRASSCYGQLTGAMRRLVNRSGANMLRWRTSRHMRGPVTVLRRVITAGVAIAGATALFASAASALVPPVNYSDTRTGPGGAVRGTVKCGYKFLESYSPVNVYDYPGTGYIGWGSRPEEWNGRRWVVLNPQENFGATGFHLRVGNNWWFFPTSRGWINPGNERPAPAQWTVAHGPTMQPLTPRCGRTRRDGYCTATATRPITVGHNRHTSVTQRARRPASRRHLAGGVAAGRQGHHRPWGDPHDRGRPAPPGRLRPSHRLQTRKTEPTDGSVGGVTVRVGMGRARRG